MAGCLAGLFALLPLILASVVVVSPFVIAPVGVPNHPLNPTLGVSGRFWLVGFYTGGLGILGGIIGTYLAASPETADA